MKKDEKETSVTGWSALETIVNSEIGAQLSLNHVGAKHRVAFIGEPTLKNGLCDRKFYMSVVRLDTYTVHYVPFTAHEFAELVFLKKKYGLDDWSYVITQLHHDAIEISIDAAMKNNELKNVQSMTPIDFTKEL